MIFVRFRQYSRHQPLLSAATSRLEVGTVGTQRCVVERAYARPCYFSMNVNFILRAPSSSLVFFFGRRISILYGFSEVLEIQHLRVTTDYFVGEVLGQRQQHAALPDLNLVISLLFWTCNLFCLISILQRRAVVFILNIVFLVVCGVIGFCGDLYGLSHVSTYLRGPRFSVSSVWCRSASVTMCIICTNRSFFYIFSVVFLPLQSCWSLSCDHGLH